MSWEGFILSLMVPLVRDAAIFSKTGDCWAADQQGNFKNIPAADIVAAQGDRAKLLAEGLRLGNRKYTLVQDKMISDGWMGLKSESSAEDEKRYSAIVYLTAHTVTVVEAKSSETTLQALLSATTKVIHFLCMNAY